MLQKLVSPLLMFIALVGCARSQTVETNKKDEIPADVRKEAVAFLREASADVNSLRTLENRVSFSAEMASLMWFNDEKEARTMFQTVINDFRQLLVGYEEQLNTMGAAPEMADVYSPDPSEKAQITRKFFKAFGVRQQIAKAIAEHDPELALSFFTETGAVISNPTFRKQIEANDVFFETQLLNEIAAKNIDTALKYGRQILAKGFNYELISLLKKVYDKDADKGAAFAEEMVSRLKSDSSKPDNFYYISRILSMGAENLDSLKGKSEKRPMFSEQSLRELADLLSQEILKREDAEGSELAGYLDDIERFQPARAAQIRQKFDIKKKSVKGSMLTASTVSPPKPIAVKTDDDSQKQLTENLQNINGKKLSEDERKKVIEQSRKIIAATPDRNQKLLALTVLAAQVAKLGDKELASDLMNDVRNLVNPQPKNYRDFTEIWMLASGYAEVDADKSFPILEETIFRLNDTISAFVKVGEFIDVSGDMIVDGEIQVGSFGGDFTGEMLRGLGAADSTIRNLAVADFTRTKNLTNKFERPEVRILAKMLILRAVLAKNEQKDDPRKEKISDSLN